MTVLKKRLTIYLLACLLTIVLAGALAGCRNISQVFEAKLGVTPANVSKADTSNTIFGNFREQGYATMEEAERAAVEMRMKDDYKGIIDHSTAESFIEAAMKYDGATDFYIYFTQYLKSSSGDSRGTRVYRDPKKAQAWKAEDGMSSHYLYRFTNSDGKEFPWGFAVVNKNGKFLLDFHRNPKYIFEDILFKFNTIGDIGARILPDPENPENVVLPIAITKCVDQTAARTWGVWLAVVAREKIEIQKLNIVTDNSGFDVSSTGKIGPDGGFIYIESPQKFGHIQKATITARDGKSYDFKVAAHGK